MINGAACLGVVVVAVLVSIEPARVGAEGTRSTSPVNVVTPAPAPSAALEPDDLPAPQPEVVVRTSIIDMPAIPDFQLPATEPGFHAPRTLLVRGTPALGSEIKVKGYVTWIYDCGAAVTAANPGVPRGQLVRAMDEDPALCEQPKIYLGDARDTPRGASLWVVDMPREPSKRERTMLSRSELKAWPVPPRLAVGDYVVVTGTWAVRSPHAEHNSNGLLVYKRLEPAVPLFAAASEPVRSQSLPAIEVVTVAPLRQTVDPVVRDASIELLNTCNRAIAAKHYEAAIDACQAATTAWDGNHLAWYGRASAHMAKSQWIDARAAIEHAVAQRPDLAMYQLYHGMTLYETGVRDAARDALRRATKLAPDLWRAHYYLGRYHRERGEGRLAAEQLTMAIRTNPGYRFGYVALVELYRRWGYIDQSLIVATLGTRNVPAAESADLWLQVGMAYEAKSADDKAIGALGRAISIRPTDAHAKLQRGRIYFRRGELASARRDLEDVTRSADPKMADGKALAAQLLARLAGIPPEDAALKTSCTPSNICHVMTPPRSSWAGENPITRL